MITWKDTFKIIATMFEIKQNDIATLLGYDKSTISKLKFGRQSQPFTSEEVFEHIFDPSNPDTPRANEHETTLLDELKEVIEKDFKNVKKDMEDCWEEKDYRTFVLRFLDRTRTCLITKGVPCNSNEEVFDFFNEAIRTYWIDRFVEKIDPTRVMDFEWVERCEGFVEYLENTRWTPSKAKAIKRTRVIVQNVQHFSQTLEDYTRYLGCHMKPLSEQAMGTFVPLFRDENVKWAIEFDKTTKKYRQQLILIYQEICRIIFPLEEEPCEGIFLNSRGNDDNFFDLSLKQSDDQYDEGKQMIEEMYPQ